MSNVSLIELDVRAKAFPTCDAARSSISNRAAVSRLPFASHFFDVASKQLRLEYTARRASPRLRGELPDRRPCEAPPDPRYPRLLPTLSLPPNCRTCSAPLSPVPLLFPPPSALGVDRPRFGITQANRRRAPVLFLTRTQNDQSRALLLPLSFTRPASSTMPSQSHTETAATAVETLNLRGKDKTPPASLHTGLRVAPLVPSGALSEAKYPREQLTPAIGVQFAEGVKLNQILALPAEERDAVLRDLAILSESSSFVGTYCKGENLIFSVAVSHNGVAFFQNQSEITPEDLAVLGLALGTLSGKPADSGLHIHPTQELGENGLPVGKISNVPDKDGCVRNSLLLIAFSEACVSCRRQISFEDEYSVITSSGWHTDVSFEPRPAA